MKKTIIISSLVVAAGLTAGIVLNQPQEVKKETPVVNVQKENSPVTAPEAPQEPEVVETSTSPSIVEKSIVEPENEPVVTYTGDELWTVTMNRMLSNFPLPQKGVINTSQLATIVAAQKPVQTMDEIDANITKCIDFFFSLPDVQTIALYKYQKKCEFN